MRNRIAVPTLQERLRVPSLVRSQCWVAGRWVDAGSGATLDVHNPATRAVVARVPNMGQEETRRAIEAAHAASPGWRNRTAHQRGQILRAWFNRIVAHQEDLAAIITTEEGKPLAEARSEIEYAAAFVDWLAEEGKRVYGDIIPARGTDRRILVMKQPVGVCAAITPWNFPAAMITRKVAAALAAGCTVVVKPAPETPLTALALAVLAEEAGVPSGVMSVITGDAVAIGRELTSNSLVRKLSFTGSTAVGRLLMRQCADTVKHVSLELGGNAPFVVFDDADLECAVKGLMASKFRNTGQTCICANRILVQEGLHEAFTDRLVSAAECLSVGDGFTPGVEQGPLINEGALEKVERHVAEAVARGAQVRTGGARHPDADQFFLPSVVTGVMPDMLICQEETFGPVVPILRFKTEAEAISLANDTPYGLAAYFYGADLARAWRVAEALDYGIVGVNSVAVSTEVAPFGGMKQSGIGREGSKYGIDEYLELKYVCIGL